VIHLRNTMLEELQRRNYSHATIRHHLRAVTELAEHFGKPSGQLGLEELRSYQAYLLKERKLAPVSVVSLDIKDALKVQREPVDRAPPKAPSLRVATFYDLPGAPYAILNIVVGAQCETLAMTNLLTDGGCESGTFKAYSLSARRYRGAESELAFLGRNGAIGRLPGVVKSLHRKTHGERQRSCDVGSVQRFPYLLQ